MHPIAWLNLGMLISQVLLTAIATLHSEVIFLAILAVNVITSAGQLVTAWVVYKQWFYQASKATDFCRTSLESVHAFCNRSEY